MTAIPSNFVTSGNAASYSTGDTLTLAFDAYLISTDSDSLVLGGASQSYDLTVDGLIEGKPTDICSGIYLQGSTNHATITINASAVVRGEAAVYLEGDADITNHGSLSGQAGTGGAGINYLGSGDCLITNTGSIDTVVGDAIFFNSGSAGTHTIDNSGTVGNGVQSAIAATSATSVELVTNTGILRGGLDLAGGNDIVHNESGIIKGSTDLGDGDDQFYGGLTSVTVIGGDGVDTIVGGRGDDVIDGGNGADSFGSPQSLDGGAGNDVITGGAGYDQIHGGTGTNTLSGGGHSDDYYVDSPTDVIVEAADGGDADYVHVSVSYTLTASAHVEFMVTTNDAGTDPINLTGNALAQAIYGNSGDNILDGGGNDGAQDDLVGLAGNDTYVLGSETLDTVTDSAGIDTITSTISRNLADFATIEKLVLLGADDIDGTGNGLANTITGNSGKNVLDGGDGSDTLAGNGGKDTFVFDTAAKGSNVDTISDFSHKDDTIDIDDAVFKGLALGTLSKDDFKLIASATSTAGVDASDRILYDKADGDLYFDRDGSKGHFDRVLFAHVTDNDKLNHADFHIV